jgi:hypothetical protein
MSAIKRRGASPRELPKLFGIPHAVVRRAIRMRRGRGQNRYEFSQNRSTITGDFAHQVEPSPYGSSDAT